jgi:hypothetical protein
MRLVALIPYVAINLVGMTVSPYYLTCQPRLT